MVSQQSTTIPLDFTHLRPKNRDRRGCSITHPVEDNETITNYILNDKDNFSKSVPHRASVF